MSRTNNSIKNFLSNTSITLITNFLNIISRTIFIQVLGASYLGINGLFSNLLSMLSLAELGIGSAISFSLYKPIAENDEEKIAVLMNFYKKAYRIIGIIVSSIGLIMLLFLDVLVPNPGNVEQLKLIFLIYVFNTGYTYFISYKNTLLTAYQQDYLLFKSNLIFSILNISFQILILYITRSYILYLCTNSVILLIQRIYINNFITNKYDFLKRKCNEPIEKKELDVIVKNVKAMMWHKLGDYCINGTDNIIISMFLSVAVVGYYSNYLMLLNLIGGYIGMIFSSMTASMGNVIATEGNEKRLEIFENINFLGFWLYSFSAICFYNLLNPFIELWLGKEYLLSQHVVLVLVLNNYMAWMRIPPYTVKSAAGLYSEDQFVPIIQSILNLVISVVLAKSIGLIGVFIGTAVSGILPSLYRPYLIYKKVFKTTSIFYYIEYCKNMSLMIGLSFFIYYLIEILNIGGVIGFIINLIICILVPNVVYLLIFRKKREFVYIYNIFKSILLGLKKRI